MQHCGWQTYFDGSRTEVPHDFVLVSTVPYVRRCRWCGFTSFIRGPARKQKEKNFGHREELARTVGVKT